MPYLVVGITDTGTWYQAHEAQWFSATVADDVRQTHTPVIQDIDGYTVLYVYIPATLSVERVKDTMAMIKQVLGGRGVLYAPRLFGCGVAYGVVKPLAERILSGVQVLWIDGYKTFNY